MSKPDTTEPLDVLLSRLNEAVTTIHTCKHAIAKYKDFGIAGSVHDLEHKQLLADAWKIFDATFRAMKSHKDMEYAKA